MALLCDDAEFMRFWNWPPPFFLQNSVRWYWPAIILRMMKSQGKSNREVILISKLHGYNVSNQDFPDSLIWLCQTVYLLLWQVSWQFEHALPDRWVLLWTGCVLVALRHSKWYLQNGQYTAVYSLGTNNRRVEWTIEKRIEDEWNSSGSRSFMSWHFGDSWK